MILKLNKPQNNLQLIQIDENYVVVDLVAKIKFNNVILLNGKIVNSTDNYPASKYMQKIIFATQSLIDQYKIREVKVIEEDNTSNNVVDSIINKFNLNIAPNYLTDVQQTDLYPYEIVKIKKVLLKSYKQAKENTYTLEQLKEAFEVGRNYQLTGENNFTEFIESLNFPKVEITFDENNQPLTAKLIKL